MLFNSIRNNPTQTADTFTARLLNVQTRVVLPYPQFGPLRFQLPEANHHPEAENPPPDLRAEVSSLLARHNVYTIHLPSSHRVDTLSSSLSKYIITRRRVSTVQ